MHDQPAQRRAALSGGAGCGKHDGPQAQRQIGARRDDRGVVAAEFEQRSSKARGHPRPERTAHGRAAGGADQRDRRMIGELLAGLAPADHELRDVRGGLGKLSNDFAQQPMQGKCGERSFFRRLPQHGVAAHQRERRIPGPHRHRKVEGGDHADRSERVPAFQQMVTGALRGDRQSVQLPRQADRKVADVDDFLHLAQAFGQDLSRLQRNQPTELRFIATHALGKPAQQLTARWRRHRAPGEERARRGLNLRFDGRGAVNRHPGQERSVHGRARLEAPGRGRGADSHAGFLQDGAEIHAAWASRCGR